MLLVDKSITRERLDRFGLFFFLMFVIVQIVFLRNEKLENLGKTERAFFHRIFRINIKLATRPYVWICRIIFFCFVHYGPGKVFSNSKFENITKKSQRIRTNCKNHNFCVHSRS